MDENLKYRIDSLMREDAQIGLYFARQLEMIRPALYEKKYPEFKARTFMPIKNDIPWGAVSYTVRSMDEAGEAEWIEGMADDEPMAEATGANEDNFKMSELRLAYGWGIDEAEKAQYAGLNLSDRKATACRRGIERFIDKKLLIGSTGPTFPGLFTLSGAVAPVTYTPTVLTWDDESAEDMYANLMGMASKIYVDSKEIEMPDTIIMPTSLKQLLMNRRMGDSNNMSVLKFFLENQEFIKNVKTSHYLESSGGHGGSGRRVVAYRNDPEMLEGLVNEIQQLAPEYRAARVKTVCRARCGGVAVHRPKSIAYMDGV